jgi:hypothetical protein
MAKLSKKLEELCIENGFRPNKMNTILLMYKDKYFMAERSKVIKYDNLFDYIKFLYKKYSIKDLNEMFDYKQLQIQDFCESKKY